MYTWIIDLFATRACDRAMRVLAWQTSGLWDKSIEEMGFRQDRTLPVVAVQLGSGEMQTRQKGR